MDTHLLYSYLVTVRIETHVNWNCCAPMQNCYLLRT